MERVCTLQRLPVELHVGLLAGLVQEDKRVDAEESVAQCGLIREVFPQPPRMLVTWPKVQPPEVIAEARSIYEKGAFERLPVLAEALRIAGCENEDALTHCRSVAPHARGCCGLGPRQRVAAEQNATPSPARM